jgi:uncharacterized phage-associated protein
MAAVFDVAKYILEKLRGTTHMKLQKLVYYSQAWSLVWDERPIFEAQIEAWANGPVVPMLYRQLKGSFEVKAGNLPPGSNSSRLSPAEKETIDAVLGYYADKGSQWLSDLTHMEPPWRNARKGLSDGERGSRVIALADMAEYYGSLPSA